MYTVDVLVEPEKYLAWVSEEGQVSGLAFKRREEDWILTVKIQRGKHNLVTFFSGDCPRSALDAMDAALKRRGGVTWQVDKYAK